MLIYPHSYFIKIIIIVGFICTFNALSFAEPLDSAEFELLSKKRASRLGVLLYSDNNAKVYSKHIIPEANSCPYDYDNIKVYTDEYKAALKEYFDNDYTGERPEQPIESIKKVELRVLVKHINVDSEILETIPPKPPFKESFKPSVAKIKYMLAPGEIEKIKKHYFPLVDKYCTDIQRLTLIYSFEELLSDENNFVNLAKVVFMRKNYSWVADDSSSQRFVSYYYIPTRMRRYLINNSSKDWLQRKEYRNLGDNYYYIENIEGTTKASRARTKKEKEERVAQFNKLKIEIDGTLIATNDLACRLSGCKNSCQERPATCPGGENAAKKRAILSHCFDNDWKKDGCKKLYEKYGKGSQARPFRAPQGFETLYTDLNEGKPIKLDFANLYFISGMAKFLVDECKLLTGDDQDLLREYFSPVLESSLFGGTHKGKDVDKSLSAITSLRVGYDFAKSMLCISPESYVLAKGMVKSIMLSERPDGDNLSKFVFSCKRHHSVKSCECLASIGRPFFPSIHTMYYDRQIIKNIIERNPLYAFRISSKCGINKY